MNRELATKVADAVLYEGYMLYPYRPSAIKNRQRWSFGILYPPGYIEVLNRTERCAMHSECLLRTNGEAHVQIQLRFLHLVRHEVTQTIDGRLQSVPKLIVDGSRIENWDEGMERSVDLEFMPITSKKQAEFYFPGSATTQALQDCGGRTVGRRADTQHELRGTIAVSSEVISESVYKLTIEITNTACLPPVITKRDDVLLRSLISTHSILAVTGGEFVSLLDPSQELAHVVAHCSNTGNFPVLVGDRETGERDMLLCSPIILYDYPQIAPESAGDFYDATEMDEMLTLRVMTLTGDEKNEMRRADDRVRQLLERTEQNVREQLMRTHGTIRSMRPANEEP